MQLTAYLTQIRVDLSKTQIYNWDLPVPVYCHPAMVGGWQKTEWDPIHSSATQNWY